MGRERESILHSQVVLVGAQLGRLGLGLVMGLVLARSLDDAGWAAFTLLGTACAFAALLVDAGLQPALVAELAAGGGSAPIFFRRVLVIRIGLALILLLPALLWRPEEPWPLLGFVLVLLALPLRSWNAIFAAGRRNRVTAFGGLAIHVVVLVAMVLVLCWRRAAAPILLILCLREIALSLHPFLRARREPLPAARPGHREPPRALFLLSAATICGAAYLHLDVFMLAALDGSTAVGDYGLALRLLMPVVVAANLLAAPFLPFLARDPGERRAPALSDCLVLGALILGALAPASVCFASSTALIEVLKGATRPAAAAALEALLGVPLAVAFGAVFSLALVVGRHYGRWALVTGLGLALNLVLNRRWIPALGAVGAARATLITECAVALLAAVMLALGDRAAPRWPRSLVLATLASAFLPALLVLGTRLLLGPIGPDWRLGLLVAVALGVALLWLLRGPAGAFRARLELEMEEGAP